MKIKIKDQIPDTEIFHLIDGEPKQNKLSEIKGTGTIDEITYRLTNLIDKL